MSSDKQRAKMEGDRHSYEAQVNSLREQMDTMQTNEHALQSAKRRAEREAADYRQKALK
ncbi:hypothetical protein BKA70DRAFT_1109667 [Coprinopsis sp. MPI-PUGE-AT-0042]|nr:hypothetical protein BKA70DRAFT_1109667 [Coprinopsis sp. MPI-PUGE-AT-0042]